MRALLNTDISGWLAMLIVVSLLIAGVLSQQALIVRRDKNKKQYKE